MSLKRFLLGASGLLWAWCYLVHFSGPSGFGGAAHGWRFFSEGAYLATLLASLGAIVALFRVRGNVGLVALSRVGTLAMVLSMVLIVVVATILAEDAAALVSLAGSVLAGMGTALVNIAWGVCLSRVEAEALERTVLGWYPIFATVFLLLALSSVSTVAGYVLPVFLFGLPLGSQVGLEAFLHLGGAASGGGDFSSVECERERNALAVGSMGEPSHLMWGYAVSLAYLLCDFVASSFVWSAFLGLRSVPFGEAMLLFAVGMGLLALITWVAFAKTRRFSLSTLFRWSLPCMVLADVAAALGGAVSLAVSCVLMAAIYVGLDSIAKLYFAYAAKRCPVHAAEMFGWGLIAGSIGGLAGSWLWGEFQMLLQGEGLALAMLVGLVPFALAAAVGIGRDPFFDKWESEELHDSALEIEDGSIASSRCERLAERYGLTPREREVVELLAQGRSRTYIRETLYISKGTVDTHAYHAYAKCGVKTKDELMRLIDEL